ncbi:MAG: hypothetical protein OXJ52_02705 [Oligoflexia bacterium]|nr:hypothetical protein [Oligoflexia bacterium]
MFKLLKDFQKQGIELFKNFENRLSESNAFNVLKEKYQSLNRGQQKLIKYFLIFFIFVSVIYLPVSYLFSSMGTWSDFKQKYILSLELLKVRNKSSSFFNLSEEDLKVKIDRVVEKYSAGDFKVVDKNKPFPKAKSIRQVDFSIDLKHLNIKQAVRLGAELNALPQMRLNAVSLEENAEYPKHYDITYQLEAFVSKGRDQAPVIKRRPVHKKKESSSPIKSDTKALGNENFKKRKNRAVRKRKAVGDP